MDYRIKESGWFPMVQVHQCGWEACEKGHHFGPAVRDHYLIHYILSGRGTFTSPRGTFDLTPGQGFIIFPEEITVYQADNTDPWTYVWVGYTGQDAQGLTKQVGLTKENPIFSAEPREQIFLLIKSIQDQAGQMRMGQTMALGYFLQFMAQIAQYIPSPNDIKTPLHRHYEKARWYMEGNYHRNIQIIDIADFVGLSRSQLFRIFIESAGLSPKESLIALRLKKALPLLEAGTYTNEEIASSIGMASPSRFTEYFKKYYHMTPTQWKKKV